MNRKIRNIVGLSAVLTAFFGMYATQALAAPQLGVSVEQDKTYFPIVYHSDERVDFLINVENEAPRPGPDGAVLTCEGGSLFGESSPGFAVSFQWLSGGQPATGTVTQTGTKTSTYEVQAADQGKPIQCVATWHTAGGGATIVSLPYAPPSAGPTYSGKPHFFPLVSKTGQSGNEQNFSCDLPPAEAWSGSPSWSYQWLRNGVPIAGETDSTYVAHIGPGEADHLVNIQCEIAGANADGTIVAASNSDPQRGFTGTEAEFVAEYGASPPSGGYGDGSYPQVSNPQSVTSGPVTVEVELPGGEETFGWKVTIPAGGSDWDCTMFPASPAQHARAVCTDHVPVRPGEAAQDLELQTGFGADIPDLATVKATTIGGGAPSATGELTIPIEPALPFGLSNFVNDFTDEAGDPYEKAGGHQYESVTELEFNKVRSLEVDKPTFNGPGGPSAMRPVAQLRQLVVDLPPGLLGNPQALPALCPSVEEVREGTCPPASQVGGLRIGFKYGGSAQIGLFAIEPEPGTPAQFAFADVVNHVYTLSARLRSDDSYAISIELTPAPEVSLITSTVQFCGFGVAGFTGGKYTCKQKGEVEANPKPLFTSPIRCGMPFHSHARLSSWDHPTFVDGPDFANGTMEGCDEVPFEPTMHVTPTTNVADSPTGLDVEVAMPTEGLEKGTECHEIQGDEASPLVPECIAQSQLRDVKVTLPKGLAVNPSGANGLEACSEAQVGVSPSGVPNDDPVQCPVASRIGSVEVVTPLLKKPLDGAVYQAEQDNNPFGSTIALYVVAELPERGVLLKLPGKVELDPETGQLTSTFLDNPQQPFKTFKLNFFGGATAPLRTPDVCGSYSTTSVLTPWSGGSPVTDTDTSAITQSASGGDCPTAESGMPNAPDFDGGTVTPVAGGYSPFVVHLRRQDGSQRFASVSLTPPAGLTAKLAGTPPCPDAALAAAEAKTGREEQASPSCPAASRVGEAWVATGAGPAPYWAKGDVYLAGPYKGAPVSLAIVTPAVAGPFDLGTVVVRTALRIDPSTAQITAESDSIPQMLEGIPLDVRTVSVVMDKPSFTRNGTSCDPLSFTGALLSTIGQLAPLSERFQLGECARLGFKPKIALTLKGGTHRADYQGLRAVVTAREGDADIGRAAVTLPHAAFLAQNHIRTVCTRVQFKADQCPAGSIYGRAEATSPLLDYPLTGSVYLRSSDNPLPDLVVKLRGPDSQPIEIDLAGRTDTVHGALRNTFDLVPDAPVSKFTLELFGGKRGLIELSTDDYCAAKHGATVEMGAQNGRQLILHPNVVNPKCKRHARRHRRTG